jgi:hypothetical protein
MYSALFGASLGVTAAGLAFVGRMGKVYLFDEEYERQVSRLRYLEKQTIFFAWLQDKLKMQAMGNTLVAQYNPVDLRPVGAPVTAASLQAL